MTEEKKQSKEELKEQIHDQECSEEIEASLKKHKRGLQPYLVVSEFGIIPRVRLSRITPEKDDKKKKD